MCGICGKLSPAGVRLQDLQRMAQAIAHRGPDDEGFYVDGCIGLGNRRLSVIDVGGGHQPLGNEDGTIWIVYNGEIYNHRQLRHELEQQGHTFGTRTDTEVIVHLYEEWGDRCVEKLSGMFAFALWDSRRARLVLARDPLGQKPLFFARMGDDFLFASEIKAILAADRRARELDSHSLHDYLSLRFVPSPRTMLRHIHKLPPAHIAVVQGADVTLKRYWQLSFYDKLDLSEEEMVAALDAKLAETVASHLVSDVPVGALLSGGMDSSMVAALMARQTQPAFSTFSIGVQEQDFDELPFARQVADHIQARQIAQTIAPDVVHLLPAIIWHLDEPSDPIAACQFAAAQLAARHVKVVLGGDGGDELFAGFDRYLGLLRLERHRRLSRLLGTNLVGQLVSGISESFAYKSTTQKLRWAHQLSRQDSLGRRYAEATCFFRFNHADKQALFTADLWAAVAQWDSADEIAGQVNGAPAADPVDQMLYADYMTRLPEHSLMLTDRMAMAHGLELRSPFLDHRLVEFMAMVPSQLKIRDHELKHILRQVAKHYLPAGIVNRPKQGFMFPVAYWFRDRLYPLLKSLLPNGRLVQERLLRPQAVLRLLEEHRSSRIDHHVRLWMLLNLELWYQMYIDQVPREAVTQSLHAYADSESRPAFSR